MIGLVLPKLPVLVHLGSVPGPTPRCMRTGNFGRTSPIIATTTQTTLCEQHSTINYSWLYQQLHEPEDKLSTSKKDADRSRLMIISKFCQLSTLKSGFF